jgi:polyhydroxyalkanoate synthesis regulator phasin
MARGRGSSPKATGRGGKPLSPAYAARLARAEAKGLTRQAARGHKPREHIERRAKERVKTGGLTYDQARRVERFVEHQAKRRRRPLDHQIAADKIKLVQWAGRVGYDKFQTLSGYVYRGERQPRHRVRPSRAKRPAGGAPGAPGAPGGGGAGGAAAPGSAGVMTIEGRFRNAEEFDEYYEDLDLPDGDESWLYYH